jgi:hypothetical protein
MDGSGNTRDHVRVKKVVGAVLFLWLVLSFLLGANDIFVREPGAPPLPLLAGVLVPIFVFLAGLWFFSSFRDLVMTIDLELAAGIQAWRFAGLGFIALYAYGILPGIFAWPAGLGDIAIGVTAVPVLLALKRRPDFAASRRFWIWNLLGILDLVTAVSLGAASAFFGIGISETTTTFPMAQLPLVIIPVFLVPLFLMLHLTSLLQARHLAEAGKTCWLEGSPVPCGVAGTVNKG